MWLSLCLLSTIISGFIPLVMKKTSLKNDAKTIAILGLFISNLIYVLISVLNTPSILADFQWTNLVKILPLSLSQGIAYICAILALKYATVSTTSPIKKGKCRGNLIVRNYSVKRKVYLIYFNSFFCINYTNHTHCQRG